MYWTFTYQYVLTVYTSMQRLSKHVDNNSESVGMPVGRNIICYMTVQPHSTLQATQAVGANSPLAESSKLCPSHYETVHSESQVQQPVGVAGITAKKDKFSEGHYDHLTVCVVGGYGVPGEVGTDYEIP